MNEVIFIHVMDKITKGGVWISKVMHTYSYKLDAWKLLCGRKTALKTRCRWSGRGVGTADVNFWTGHEERWKEAGWSPPRQRLGCRKSKETTPHSQHTTEMTWEALIPKTFLVWNWMIKDCSILAMCTLDHDTGFIPHYSHVLTVSEMSGGLLWSHSVYFYGFDEGKRTHHAGCVDWNTPLISRLLSRKHF